MLTDTIYNLLLDIIGNPTNVYETTLLYCVSCFIFILVVKLTYDLITYLFGIKK